jgi:hypothetical protein
MKRLFFHLIVGFFSTSSAVACAVSGASATTAVASNLTTPSTCNFGAFVNETDRAGLNVRQTPNAKGKLVGKLPPNYDGTDVDTLVHYEVQVLASQNGWFLIKGATENSMHTEKPARPTGWVSGKKLAIKTQASKARLAPEANAGTAFLVGNVLDGDSLSKPGHLVACNGKWVLVEYSLSGISKGELSEIKINPAAKQGAPKGHVRGWVNRICAIQETSCDGLGNEP